MRGNRIGAFVMHYLQAPKTTCLIHNTAPSAPSRVEVPQLPSSERLILVACYGSWAVFMSAVKHCLASAPRKNYRAFPALVSLHDSKKLINRDADKGTNQTLCSLYVPVLYPWRNCAPGCGLVKLSPASRLSILQLGLCDHQRVLVHHFLSPQPPWLPACS